MLDEAVDEFIEEKKQRFPDHYKEFGMGKELDDGKILRPKNAEVPRQEELDEEENPEKARKELNQKILARGEMFEEEADENDSDITEEDSDSEEKWDCESILTTHTNTDNHPGVIKTERRVKPSQRMQIQLHKQFRVPIDGLIPLAEEVTIQKEKKQKGDARQPFQRLK